MPEPITKLVNVPQLAAGVFVAEIMVKVSPLVWPATLSTRPSTMPVTVAGLTGPPGPEKLKLKLSAEAAPAWRQLINSAAPKAARPMNFLKWCGRECISAK
jgi:hypothetical protein